jgi:hypothetical protein
MEALLQAAASTGVLHLTGMGLTALPPAVLDLHGLVRLDLSGNELRELPEDLGRALTGLEELWLNDNPLVSLPPSLERCLSLRILDLRDTELTSLPRGLCRLSSLEHVDLRGTRLPAPLLTAVARGGTTALISHLGAVDARDNVVAALSARLRQDVYREEADTVKGGERLASLATELAAEFRDSNQLRTVIRNAERLLPLGLMTATAHGVRARYEALAEENARKALGADVELALRALYSSHSLSGRAVEGLVADVMAHMNRLEDATFLLRHAKALLPPTPAGVSGARLLAELTALRDALAAERAAATAVLTRALRSVYPDREPADVSRLAAAVAALLPTAADVLSLAGDAGTLFPPELGGARAKTIAAAFFAAKAEKGL